MMKNNYNKLFLTLFALALIAITLFCSCQKEKVCNVGNPKEDLPWLKEFIDGVEENAQLGVSLEVKIYQCIYRDGIGFLIEPCVGCPDAGDGFANCDGIRLCGGGGISGKDDCSEYNIKKRKLIYQHKK